MTRTLLSAVAAVALALPLPVGAAPARPTVVKVEPPSWWPGHSINPVRLLVRGQNLAGCRGDERRGGAHDGPGEGERRGKLSLRGRDDRPARDARARARSASAPREARPRSRSRSGHRCRARGGSRASRRTTRCTC